MSAPVPSTVEVRSGRVRQTFSSRLRSLLGLIGAVIVGLLMVSAVLAMSSTHTFHATAEQVSTGIGISGSTTDTHATDNTYRVLQEEYVSGITGTLGDNPSEIAYASTITDAINFTPYTMPAEGGFIYRAAIYITETGETQFRVALYGDTEGQPRLLLAQSDPLTVTDVLTQPGWLWFDLMPQSIPGDTPYWLAYQASNENAKLGLKYSHPSSGYYHRSWTWGPFPDVAGRVWGPISRRALYQVAYTATRYALDATYTVPVTSGMNAYTLTVHGATSEESFTVTADGQAAGTISYTPTTQHFFSDDMESGTGGWTATGFTLIVTDEQHYNSATHAWWTDDVPYACMNYLTSTPITLPFNVRDGELRFWHRVVSEHNYDGGWIEYRAQDLSGTWSDWSNVTETWFIQGSYNATVSGTHPAWSGTVTDVVRIQVPATAAGHPAQWRWVFRCDPLGIEGPYQPDGWWIDDVHMFGTVSGNTVLVFPLPLSLTSDSQVTVRFQDTLTNTYADALGIDLIAVAGFQENRPPTLTVTAPNGGEYWGGTRTIEWRGSDPNQDVITYNVYLSTDGGSTWSTSLYQVAYSEAEAPTIHTWNGFDTTAYADGANYLMRIEASDGEASASDQSNAVFTIDNTPPSVALSAPNGGQLLRGGSSFTIIWSASDAHFSSTPIALYYSTNGGASFPNLITSATENGGSYAWTVPTVESSSVRVRVAATDRGGNSGQDDSDNNFTIDSTAPAASLSAPNGGEILQSGSNFTITWNASDAHLGSTPIAIYYSTNGGTTFPYVIATATENDGSYVWTIPALDSSSVRVRVMATDLVGHTGHDGSDGNFTVDSTVPSVTLTAPNGGELLQGGSNYTITWSASDTNFGPVPIALYYSTDGGTSFPNLIVAATENDGSYVWTVPTLENASASVRVIATDLAGNANNDASNANFSIDSTAPTVAITGPNGGEYLQGGHDASITWNASDAHFGATPIALYYSTDGGASFPNLIVAATANDGAYTWAVPALNNTSMRVRAVATDLVGHSSQDNSDANFTVDSTAPGVTLIAPNGGQIFYNGDSCQITWNASDAHFGATPIALYYSTDGGASFPSLIIAGTENDGAYTWAVPALDSIHVRVRVVATDLAGNSSQDDSDANFIVNSTSPNGTVTIAEGDYTNGNNVHLALNAPDDTTEMYLDGDVADASNVRHWITYSPNATVTLTTGEGSKTVTVVYKDAVGNEGDPASDMIIYDISGPTMNNATPAAGSTVTTSLPAIGATLADTLSGINSTTITMTVDGKLVAHAYSVSTGVISYTPSAALANGSHTVAISARDSAGNPGSWTWSFSVDATRWVYLPFVVRMYLP